MELDRGSLKQITDMIDKVRNKVEVTINSELVLLYWNVGRVIRTDILEDDKAEYGQNIIKNLSEELSTVYGRGYSQRNLFNMVKLYDVFEDELILQTLSAKLTWSHFTKLIYIKEPLKIEFYTAMTLNENWSVRELTERMNSQLYERTNLSKKPELTIAKDIQELRDKKEMSKNLVLRDPYVLDFLDLRDSYSEKDLESAIIRELERFILEMGRDFAFVGRQVRLTFKDVDYYIDLLLYHRKLRCLVVVELKLGKFKPEYKGQVELYLNYLEKHEMNEGENLPIGIILCSSKETELVELMKLDEARIHVAEVITRALAKKLPEAIEDAKTLIEQRQSYITMNE